MKTKPISQADAYHQLEAEKEAAEDMRALAAKTVIPADVRARMDEDREKAQRPLYPCAKCNADIEDADYVTIDGKHYCDDCAKVVYTVESVNERVGSPTETLPDPQYTPEKVREMFKLIARKRVNMAEMNRLFSELEHTLAVKVGEELVLSYPRHNYMVRTKDKKVCERCGALLGVKYADRVVQFDGRWWHKHNCGGRSS